MYRDYSRKTTGNLGADATEGLLVFECVMLSGL